jgi:hypothetical protein
MLNVGKFYGAGIKPPLGGFLNDGKTVHVLIDAIVLAAKTAVPAGYYQIANSRFTAKFFSGELARPASAGVFSNALRREAASSRRGETRGSQQSARALPRELNGAGLRWKRVTPRR